MAALAGLALGIGIGVGWAAQEPAAPPAHAPTADEPPLPAVPQTPAVGPPEQPRSRALGKPFHRGRLLHGIEFPPEGVDHFTWDPVRDTSPNRWSRRYATDRTVLRVLEALAAFRHDHPEAPPVGVGDLSRPKGGSFGRSFGGLGHASHQNGLDVDVYYPRKDRALRAPMSPDQVDRRLAQALVDAFLDVGATDVFTGPSLDLKGPKRIVRPLIHHDDHLHARFAP